MPTMKLFTAVTDAAMRDYDSKPIPDTFVGKTATDANRNQKPPQIESKREWEHSEKGGRGKDCYRYGKPVYTPPQKIPDECHSCDNNDWNSKGVIKRLVDSKKIIERNGKKVD